MLKPAINFSRPDELDDRDAEDFLLQVVHVDALTVLERRCSASTRAGTRRTGTGNTYSGPWKTSPGSRTSIACTTCTIGSLRHRVGAVQRVPRPAPEMDMRPRHDPFRGLPRKVPDSVISERLPDPAHRRVPEQVHLLRVPPSHILKETYFGLLW